MCYAEIVIDEKCDCDQSTIESRITSCYDKNMSTISHLISKLVEPKKSLDISRQKFSNQDLYHLILPIIIEQLLTMLVGICDTMMVSYAGEAAVSGVSLVNQVNYIFIFIFGAIASGGAVVASQYIGRGDKKQGILATGQLIMITTLIAIFMMLVAIVFRKQLLSLLFGRVEADVMQAALTYLVLSSVSFPMLAIYNSSSAIFRSMSMTKTVMNISLIMNAINVVGNAIGIFGLHAGVAGVAVPSIISRTFAAVSMFVLLLNKKNTLYIEPAMIFRWEGRMLKRILNIAVPNGIENGLFQFAKVVITSIVAMFGTVQIAANGIAQSFWSVAALFAIAMGYAFVTVIGQCMGAGDIEAADYYNNKLLRITYVCGAIWNIVFLLLTPLIMQLYSLENETRTLTIWLIVIHGVFNMVWSPIAFPLASGLRAAGDIRYTMFASIFATVVCRVFFSALLGIWLGLGVLGITFAMCIDWIIKAVIIWVRYKNRKWTTKRVI